MRGLETTAGRLSGVVTERGPIRCGKVVLAGGAWSRLFCGNLGVELPQLKLLASVMRTGPVEGAPDRAAGADNFAFRKRLDGGYTIARRNANVAELAPDSFRLFFDFLPALVTQWHELRLRVGRSFLEEWRIPRRWALDAETPFETVRTLDPAPSLSILDEGVTTPLATGVPFNWKDLTPVAMLALDQFVLWVNAETPYKTAKEYIDAVKAAGPNKFKMGGTGSKQEDQIITVGAREGHRHQVHLHPVQGRRRRGGAAGRQAHRLHRQQPDRGGGAMARRRAAPAVRVRRRAHALQGQGHRHDVVERHPDLQGSRRARPTT